MQYSTIKSGAAVLLAIVPAVFAAGTAHVVNKCGFPVYFASVAPGKWPGMQLLPKEGYSEAFYLDNGGISIKLATTPDEKPTQFEYTWAKASGKVSYDISNIDGNPFVAHGMQLSPSAPKDAANPTCKNVTCVPGVAPCFQAYNLPNDVRTMVCDQSSDLTLTLCPSLDAAAIAAASTLARRHYHRSHARQVKF